MRIVICSTSLLLATMTLIGCGQTGALTLPNDPKQDKRAQYLLYKDADQKAQTEKALKEKADAQAAASEVTQTN